MPHARIWERSVLVAWARLGCSGIGASITEGSGGGVNGSGDASGIWVAAD